MLNSCLSLLCIGGPYKIYIEFILWKFVQNYHLFYLTLCIDLYLLLNYLWDGIIFIQYESFWVYTIIGEESPISNPVQERKKAYFT